MVLRHHPERIYTLARVRGESPEAEAPERREEHHQEVQHLLQHHPLQGRQARCDRDQVRRKQEDIFSCFIHTK